MLGQTYPDARCELDFDNPFELLVVTVLSAQTTDKRVNAVRPTLFAAYPDAPAMAAADRETLEAIIGPLGFFRAKTESLLKLSAALVERHGGEVPPRLKDLVELPGVGRKTANVVLGNAFGIPGITVDTHFGRLARRFGWTEETDPVKAEHAVGALFPKKDWVHAQPPPDLARPALLPRPEAGLRRLPGGALVPVVRRRADRPRDRRQAAPHRGPRMSTTRGRAGRGRPDGGAGRLRRRRETPIIPGPGPSKVKVDTPELRALKAEAGMEDCVPGPGRRGAARRSRCRASAGAPASTSSSLRGPMVLSLWQAGCAPCKEEMPALQAFHEQYGDQVPVLGVDFARPVPRQRPGGGRASAESPTRRSPTRAATCRTPRSSRRCRACPTMYFVDADGRSPTQQSGGLDSERARSPTWSASTSG